MKELILLKSPSDCTAEELEAFCRLVLNEGQVSRERFQKRVEKAERLAFLMEPESGTVIGTAAVKRPDPGYRWGVFEKAGAAELLQDGSLELGWIVISPDFQRRGHCGRLVAALLQDFGQATLYATSRIGNLPMHSVLRRFGFKSAGRPYVSKNRSGETLLFVRGPLNAGSAS